LKALGDDVVSELQKSAVGIKDLGEQVGILGVVRVVAVDEGGDCPLPRSGRIFWRMLPNCHPIGGWLVHREFGKRATCPGILPRTPLTDFLSYPASTPHSSALV